VTEPQPIFSETSSRGNREAFCTLPRETAARFGRRCRDSINNDRLGSL
jgi:hypothetical protein